MQASGIGLLLFRWKIRQSTTETAEMALLATRILWRLVFRLNFPRSILNPSRDRLRANTELSSVAGLRPVRQWLILPQIHPSALHRCRPL